MRLLLLLIAGFLCQLGSAIAAGDGTNLIGQTFTVSGSRYVFTGSFTITGATSGCLLDMLYQTEQLRRYARHIDSLELLGFGRDWQIIAYRYSGLFYHARSVFRRQIDREAGRIDYTLQTIEQSGLFSADISGISGHYSVSEAGSLGLRVLFHQQGFIGASALRGFYFDNVRSTALEFLTNMQSYAVGHCGFGSADERSSLLP